MFRYVLRQERVALSLAALALVLVGSLAPSAPGPRTWVFIGLSLLLPALLIGRMHRRRSAGWAHESNSAHGAGRLYLLDCALSWSPAILLGFVGGWGEPAATVALIAWCIAVICFVDLLDRTLADVRVVWLIVLGSLVLYLTGPLWLAPAFGQTEVAPWLATVTIGFHPAAVVLGALELPTLQDPVFYRFTLSGVVEVRPVWWGWGALSYLGAALVSLAICYQMRRRLPPARGSLD